MRKILGTTTAAALLAFGAYQCNDIGTSPEASAFEKTEISTTIEVKSDIAPSTTLSPQSILLLGQQKERAAEFLNSKVRVVLPDVIDQLNSENLGVFVEGKDELFRGKTDPDQLYRIWFKDGRRLDFGYSLTEDGTTVKRFDLDWFADRAEQNSGWPSMASNVRFDTENKSQTWVEAGSKSSGYFQSENLERPNDFAPEHALSAFLIQLQLLESTTGIDIPEIG